MRKERFYISISSEKWYLYYKGAYQNIVVYTYSGIRMSLPASNFIPYASFSGVEGTFEVTFSEQNKILDIKKLFD